jgi:glycosyltransferase involved in cell wall biosynthesis
MPGDPSQRLIAPDFRRVANGFKALRPDIVVAVTPGPFGLLGRYYAKRNGAAFLTAFHTDFEQLARLYWRPLTRSIVNGYLRNINRFLCKSSAAVLVNNSNLCADVENLGAKKVEVMGTPLQNAFLKTPQASPASQVKRICFAGRLAAEKNVDQIIATAADFPEIEFVIGGDGPERETLEAAAARNPRPIN